jgi:hypothetical protein
VRFTGFRNLGTDFYKDTNTQAMSAGGSASGTDYVWIKLATAKDVFAKIYYSPGKLERRWCSLM